jgi:pyridine nucleotide-disulfide oxidoreductase family protein
MTAHAKTLFSESNLHPEGPGYQPRTLVLLGAGHAHVHVLATLATQRLVSTRVILLAPHPRQMYSGMVPGFVAGHYTLDECVIPLEPLVHKSGVRWLQRSVKQLDANSQMITLDDGSTLHYDWISVNTGSIQNRDLLEKDMPGVRTQGLFVRPIETFAALWPRVAEMGDARPLRIAVIGAGAAGFEIAMAVRHRLPSAALTLICGTTPPGAQYPQSMQNRILNALKKRRITVLQDSATGFDKGEVRLGSGATLACDVPILATGAQAPTWLQASGLALDAQGFLAVNEYQRSTSHAQVFAAGDVSTRTDRTLARSGVYAVRAGPTLAHNLAATTEGGKLKPHHPPARTLNLLSCGERYAIGTWGNFSAQGRWVWRLKNWIDRRFMARYSKPS